MEPMDINMTDFLIIPSSFSDNGKIFGKCTIEILSEWQLALNKIHGGTRVFDVIWPRLHSQCPNVEFDLQGSVVTAVRGSLDDVFKAITELQALIMNMTEDFSSSLRSLKSASHHTSSASSDNHSNYGYAQQVSASSNHAGVERSNQTMQPFQLSSQLVPNYLVPTQGSASSSLNTGRKAKAIFTEFLTVDLNTWIYAEKTRSIDKPKSTWWNVKPGVDTRASELEVTSAADQVELDETMERIREVYIAVDKENIVCWPIVMNACVEGSVIQSTLLQKYDVVLYCADSDKMQWGNSAQQSDFESEGWKYRVVGPRSTIPMILPIVIDFIVQMNGSKAVVVENFYSTSWKLPSWPFGKKANVDQFNYQFTTSCGLRVHICQGDLVRQRVDAIVNPTNEGLINEGGASKCIAEAAGSKLVKACQEHIRSHGRLVVSEPMHTPAGNLSPQIKHVIHVVGPCFNPHNGTGIEAVYKPLTKTFFNCLDYADRQIKLGSVAMPAISSGSFGIPISVVARRAFEGLLKFNDRSLQTPPSERHLRKVVFVSIDPETTREMVNIFRCLAEATDIGRFNTSMFCDTENANLPRHTRRLHRGLSKNETTEEFQSPSSNKATFNEYMHSASAKFSRFGSEFEGDIVNKRFQFDPNSSTSSSEFHGVRPDARRSTYGSEEYEALQRRPISECYTESSTFDAERRLLSRRGDGSAKSGKSSSSVSNSQKSLMKAPGKAVHAHEAVGQPLKVRREPTSSLNCIDKRSCGLNEGDLVTNDFTRVAVFGHTFSFYRCIAIFANSKLRNARRTSHGNPMDKALWKLESDIAEDLRDKVAELLLTSYKSGDLQGCTIDSRNTSGFKEFNSLQKRIDDIKAKFCREQKVDPLEILAVAFFTKTQIQLYQEDASGYRLYAKYPCREYELRPPITLLFSADVQRFEVLLNNDDDSMCVSSCESATDLVLSFTQSVAKKDEKITFQQLIGSSLALSTKLDETSLLGVKQSSAKTNSLERNLVTSDQNKSYDDVMDKEAEVSASSPTDKCSHVDSGQKAADAPAEQNEVCVICMEEMTQETKKLDCGHVFCTACIDDCFKRFQPKCPSCGKVFGALKGNQPPGTFRKNLLSTSLAGYEKFGTIEILYNFPSGKQTAEHPNPGQPYSGTSRTAYLPDCPEGQEVCKLLERAFDDRLVFTIDRSVTTGMDNCVVWNNIHHKTSPSGTFGYPDPNYLERVKQELAAKGIVSKATTSTSEATKAKKSSKRF